MVIWKYDVPAAATSVGWAVVVNNVEALRILLGTEYGQAMGLAAAGAGVRWVVGQGVLGSVGLGEGWGGGWGAMEGWGDWVGRLGLGK